MIPHRVSLKFAGQDVKLRDLLFAETVYLGTELFSPFDHFLFAHIAVGGNGVEAQYLAGFGVNLTGIEPEVVGLRVVLKPEFEADFVNVAVEL